MQGNSIYLVDPHDWCSQASTWQVIRPYATWGSMVTTTPGSKLTTCATHKAEVLHGHYESRPLLLALPRSALVEAPWCFQEQLHVECVAIVKHEMTRV